MPRTDETQYRLIAWSSDSAAAERLAVQVLLASGFTDADPSHPYGGRDGGRDAMFQRAGEAWVLAVYFPRSNPSFAEIKAKFKSDLAGALRHSPSGFAFVTNQELTLGQRADLGELAQDVQLEIFHMERVAALLDQPMMAGVRQQFLGIDSGPVPLSITLAIDGIGRFFSSGMQVREILLDREDGSLRDDAEEARNMPAAEREAEAQMARILNRPAPAEPPSAG